MNPRLASLFLFVAVAQLAAPHLPAQGPVTASAAKAALPVVIVQEIETASPSTYALLIADANKAAKQKVATAGQVRVFVGESAGPDAGKTIAVTTGESFAQLAANSALLEQELALAKARTSLAEVRTLGAQVALKAVRWEGRHATPFVMNTRMVVADEVAYLEALQGLRERMDKNGLQDVKLNCMRVVAGRTDHTHVVSLNAPSAERRGALMDALASEAWAQEWIASAAKLRTVVSNGTFREISK